MRHINQGDTEEESMSQMQESLDKFSKSVSQRKVLIQRKNSLKEIQTEIIRSAQSIRNIENSLSASATILE